MHKANIGPTGCGKTYQAIAEARRAGGPLLFINPKNEEQAGMVRMDGTAEKKTLARILKKGLQVNYVPHRDRKVALRELDIVIGVAFDIGNIRIIFDEAEVHGYEGLSFSPLFDVAERGRSAGVEGLFLVQDPAGVSKRILRNCEQFRVFAFNEYSRQYFERLGYNTYQMSKKLLEKGNYSYIIMERGQIKGIGKE